MKVSSLFAGCGGLDLGLKNAGHDLVYAHDIDKDCVDTYKNYFGDHIIHGDIKDLDGKSIPDIDLITGGFPCQGFSIANEEVQFCCFLNQFRAEQFRATVCQRCACGWQSFYILS